MKRMVLIPEEKLLHYEQRERQDSNRAIEEGDGCQKGGGWIEDLSAIKEEDVNLNRWLKKQGGGQGGGGLGKNELTDDMIVRGIPKTMKTRAMALLERLKTRPEVISWDSMGQVKINGTLIPKSNISDLISDAMRPRKSFNPKGSSEFFKVLNEINVPKDLVRNDDRWEESEKKRVTFGESVYYPIEKRGKSRAWGDVLRKQRERRRKNKKNQKGGWMAYYGVPIRTDD